jgi:hypothetical protein
MPHQRNFLIITFFPVLCSYWHRFWGPSPGILEWLDDMTGGTVEEPFPQINTLFVIIGVHFTLCCPRIFAIFYEKDSEKQQVSVYQPAVY